MKKQSNSVIVPIVVSVITCAVLFLGYNKYTEIKRAYDQNKKQTIDQNFQKGLNKQGIDNKISITNVALIGGTIKIQGEVPKQHTVKWVFTDSGCGKTPWYTKEDPGSSTSIKDNKFEFSFKVAPSTSDDSPAGYKSISFFTSHYEKYDDLPDEQILGDGTKVCHLCNPMNKTREAWIDTPNLFIREWSKEVCNSDKKEWIPSINTDISVVLDLKKNEWCQIDNYSGGSKACSKISTK